MYQLKVDVDKLNAVKVVVNIYTNKNIGHIWQKIIVTFTTYKLHETSGKLNETPKGALSYFLVFFN